MTRRRHLHLVDDATPTRSRLLATAAQLQHIATDTHRPLSEHLEELAFEVWGAVEDFFDQEDRS